MIEDIFDLSIIASSEELTDFLKLWGTLFAVVFTLRLLQRLWNTVRRWQSRRQNRREEHRLARRRKST